MIDAGFCCYPGFDVQESALIILVAHLGPLHGSSRADCARICLARVYDVERSAQARVIAFVIHTAVTGFEAFFYLGDRNSILSTVQPHAIYSDLWIWDAPPRKMDRVKKLLLKELPAGLRMEQARLDIPGWDIFLWRRCVLAYVKWQVRCALATAYPPLVYQLTRPH